MTLRMGKTKWIHSSYLEVCGLSPSFWHAVFDLATSLLAICPKGIVKGIKDYCTLMFTIYNSKTKCKKK